MYDLENVGERIKALRLQKNEKQEDVSNALGIKLDTYQAIERGKRVGRVDTLCILAEYYDTTVEYLLGNDRGLDHIIEINYEKLSDSMKVLAKKQIVALLSVMQ